MHRKLLPVIALLLVAITRLPVAPNRLTVEGVNLAFAFEQMEPMRQQPHAPGFPFLVTAGRILSFFIPDLTGRAYWFFLVLSILTAAACLAIIFKLGSEMYADWEGKAAALLLLVTPIFWFATLSSPVWPLLALFTLLSAWFSWKAWDGDRQNVFYGAITLAIAFGILPEAVLYMFPLWLFSAWRGTRSIGAITRGVGVILAGVVLALDILWVATGSVEAMRIVLSQYPFGTDVPSLDLPLTQPRLWVRSAGRFVFWMFIAAAAWAWVFAWRRKLVVLPESKHKVFFLIWLLPAAIIHFAGGLSGPAQMLVYVPALCLVGGRVLEGLGSRAVVENGIQARELSLAVALMISVILFGEFVRLPAAGSESAGLNRFTNIATYSIWETSLGPLRWSGELSDTSLWEVGNLTRTERPTVIVAMDRPQADLRAVEWRIASYYERNREIWVLSDSVASREARKVRGRSVLEIHKESPFVITVPKGARIIWLADPGSDFMNEVKNKVGTNLARKYVTYTDLEQAPASFTIGAFLFRTA